MTADLLPCPFCGTQPNADDVGPYAVTCPSCGVDGPAGTKYDRAGAVVAWNARAQAPAEGDDLRCPACGSDRNERDELIKAEREVERLYARIVELAELVPIAEANERERCAQACEQLSVSNRTTIVAAEHYDECAAAIRALSKAQPKGMPDDDPQAILKAALYVMPNTAEIRSEEQAEDIVAVWRAAVASVQAPAPDAGKTEADHDRARALEVIALGESTNPVKDANDALVTSGWWTHAAASPAVAPEKVRAEFESWARGFSTFSLERDNHGGYVSMEQELLWLGYQAGKAKAPEGASGGDSNANAGLGLAAADSACAHEFALQPSSSILICSKCGLGEVAARVAAPKPPVQKTGGA